MDKRKQQRHSGNRHSGDRGRQPHKRSFSGTPERKFFGKRRLDWERRQNGEAVKPLPAIGDGGGFEGVVSVNSRGVGYVAVEGFEDDIEISTQSLRTALHGDTVRIILHPTIHGARRQGEVVEIVKRARMEFVGTMDKSGDTAFLIPDDKRMYMDILISPEDAKRAETGDKALVRIKEWKHPRINPVGEILKVLGRKGSHEVEMQSIILERGIVYDFPPEVEREADEIARNEKAVGPDEVAKRRDFRDTLTFTIDPADAKDFDDALSFKDLGGGRYEIGIHIADVSHYVREGSALDREARKRGFSVYLVDRTIPMLPEILSNGLCSLNPNEEKLAFSAVFVMDKDGKVHERWFGKTVIRSDKRFAYEDAQKVLDEGRGNYHAELDFLNRLAKSIRAERYKKGAIDFDTVEVKFKLDENGKPLGVYKKERLDTHRLVEEYMLFANREVAELVFKSQKKGGPAIGPPAKRPFLYRIHDLPDKDRLADLNLFIKALGFTLGRKGKEITAFDISRLLEEVEGASQESLVKTAAIRSMAKAIYSTKNIGHFGLAFEYYTHFTSPIRRYPDLIVHRLLDKYLKSPDGGVADASVYERIAMESSEQEVKAADAERASIKYKQVEYMKDKIGQTFSGTITGITEWGVYVEDDETKAEGMVKIRDIGDDFYEVDPKTYSLVGSRLKKRLSLGDKVKVKLVAADLDRKTLDFKFA